MQACTYKIHMALNTIINHECANLSKALAACYPKGEENNNIMLFTSLICQFEGFKKDCKF